MVDYDQVGEPSRRERSFLVFVERGVRGAGSVGAERILDADFLFRHPTSRMLVIECPAGHRGVNALQRRCRRDRPIAAKSQSRAGLLERAERVGSLRALGSDDFLRPASVVDGVVRLHAWYDAEFAEAGDVRRGDVLRVLDAEATIPWPVLARDPLEDVELQVDGAI